MSEKFKERIAISNTGENDANTHKEAIEYRNAVHKVFSEYSPYLLADIHEKIRELCRENRAKSEKEETGLINLMEALECEMFAKIHAKSQIKDDSEVEWWKVVDRINEQGRTGNNYIWLLRKYSIEELEAMLKDIELF